MHILKFKCRFGISYGHYIPEFPLRNIFFLISEDGLLPRLSKFIGCCKSATRFVISLCAGLRTFIQISILTMFRYAEP
jgi:hypothetical protein